MLRTYPKFRYWLFIYLVVAYHSTSALPQPSLVKQALVFFDQEDYTAAKSSIDQAIQDEQLQKEASTWYYRGVIYEQLLRKSLALEIAKEYLQEATKAYHKTLNLTSSPTQYHSFAQLNLKGLWLYFLNRGVRYYNVTAFHRAIDQFTLCSKIDPTDPYAVLYKAIAAHQVGKYDIALRAYQTYLQLTKGEAAVYRALAHLLAYELNQPNQAHKILAQAIQQYPWEVGLLAEQNQLWIQSGDLTAQAHVYQSALNKNLSDPCLVFRLGYLCEQTGNLTEAAIYYKQATKMAPKQFEPIFRLGIVYYNQAAKIINQAANMSEELLPQVAQETNVTAETYLKESLFYFKQARKMQRFNILVINHLSTIYEHLGRLDKVNIMQAAANRIKRIKGGAILIHSPNTP